MKWAREEKDGPCAISSGAFTISVAPQLGYIRWDGFVRYELSKPGLPIRMIRCADTEADRARTVAVLKALAKA